MNANELSALSDADLVTLITDLEGIKESIEDVLLGRLASARGLGDRGVSKPERTVARQGGHGQHLENIKPWSSYGNSQK